MKWFSSNYKRAAVAAGLAVVARTLLRSGVLANIEYVIRDYLMSNPPRKTPLQVKEHAERIVNHLNERGVTPQRIAVDGVPGSGKSTLARELASRLHMEWICLHYRDINTQLDFELSPAIYEHHRLLRTQSIEKFDVLIYIDEPVEDSIHKIMQRKKSAVLAEVLDYPLLKEIGKKAFELANGEVFDVGSSCYKVNIRPDGGFCDINNALRIAEEKRLEVKKLHKEQLIFMVTRRMSNEGLSAYVSAGKLTEDAILSLGAALAPGVGKSINKSFLGKFGIPFA